MSEENPEAMNDFDAFETPSELKAFEAALAALAPRADRLNRDRLLFLAGQQRKVGYVHQEEKTSEHRWWARPTLRAKSAWAWPAAFGAMTGLTIVLAILLAIRPTVPTVESNGTSIASSGARTYPRPLGEGPGVRAVLKPAKAFHQETSLDSLASETETSTQPPSPLYAFLQSLWPADAGKAVEERLPATGSMPYPQLRDQILRHGLDSWQVAQSSPNIRSSRLSEPSTYQQLLKEYLPELK